MPESLLRSHRLPEGKWGVIEVDSGELCFIAQGEVVINVMVTAGSSHGIPPGLDHAVTVSGPVRFSVAFFAVESGGSPLPKDEVDAQQERPITDVWLEEGGDPACWANLVCPDCGSMIEDEHHTHGPDLGVE